jgi:hypothetical protein
VPDTWWDEVVDDKGLNPPPTGILLYSGVANVIPIRAEGLPTYLLTTLLDALLIAVSFLGLRKTFGANAAALAAVTFGGSFIASFGWLGGAVLRFAWVAAIALSLWAMRRRRWGLAGILMGCAICDRIFPAAFALGAALPLALQSRHSPRSRRELGRFALGVVVTVSLAVGLSVVVFGFDSFHVFAARLARDSGVHNVLHIGLDKILTYRSWTASQSFGGLDGLLRFRHWNEHIDATWRAIRIPAVLLELLVMGLAMRACLRLHPFEASVLFGVTAMFTLASPSNYYYVILALVPAVVFRRASTAPLEARLRDLAPLLALSGFVIVTLLLPEVIADRIVVDLWICIALAAALGVWIRCAGRPWMTRVRRSL